MAVDARRRQRRTGHTPFREETLPTVSACCGLRGFGQEGHDIEVPEYLVDGFCTNGRKILLLMQQKHAFAGYFEQRQEQGGTSSAACLNPEPLLG
jgi:hypothetical protein